MNANEQQESETPTRSAWPEIISRHATPPIDLPLKRKHQRYSVEFGMARLLPEEDGRPLTHVISLLDVSAEGLMLRTDKPIPVHALLRIEVTLDDESVVLRGRVAHSTQAVGGFKTGIQLQFPAD